MIIIQRWITGWASLSAGFLAVLEVTKRNNEHTNGKDEITVLPKFAVKFSFHTHVVCWPLRGFFHSEGGTKNRRRYGGRVHHSRCVIQSKSWISLDGLFSYSLDSDRRVWRLDSKRFITNRGDRVSACAHFLVSCVHGIIFSSDIKRNWQLWPEMCAFVFHLAFDLRRLTFGLWSMSIWMLTDSVV